MEKKETIFKRDGVYSRRVGEEMKNIVLAKLMREFIYKNDKAKIDELLKTLHTADIAEVLEKLNTEERISVYNRMNAEDLSELMTGLSTNFREELISSIDNKKLKNIFAHMSNDDIVDIFGEISKEEVDNIMKLLDIEEVREVERLSKHESDTAGGLMTSDYFSISSGTKIKDALFSLKKFGDEAELAYYVYVVEEETEILKGITTLKDLILNDQNIVVDKIMETNVISVIPSIDQEKVASKFSKYDLLALPVVNEVGKLLGIITVDDILDVIEEEATEDIYAMAGITEEEMQDDLKFLKSVKMRLPWLMVSFFGELLSALIMQNSEKALTMTALIFFVPLVMATGGNSGSQASAVMVRKIALGELDTQQLKRTILKESLAGLTLGLISGVMVGLISNSWQGSYVLGIIVGISLFTVISLASVIGIVTPLLFNKLKIDPAVASGPLITTVNDVGGLMLYFTIATVLLRYLG